MLQSISWSEFFTVIAAGLAIYYVLAGLLLYSEEIKAKLVQRRPSIIPDVISSDQEEPNESIHLMGSTAPESLKEQDEQTVSSTDLEFKTDETTEPEIEATPAANATPSLANTLSELFSDVKSIAEVISSNSKEDLGEMFRTLLERYPQLIAYRDSLSQFIINSCGQYCTYPIELDEVNSWWPSGK